MGRRLTRNKKYIKSISNTPVSVQKRILATADRDFIETCRDCCENILEGRVNIPPKTLQKLHRHKAIVRRLGRENRVSLKAGRELLQKGGFFAALLPILSSLIGPVLSGIFGAKKIRWILLKKYL